MTDEFRPPPARPIQRLDGPEALLPGEWNVADLPWITPEETQETDSARPSGRVLPPTPPSQRGGPPTAFMAGSAAPLGATGTRIPLIARPKPRQPELEIRPSVVLANDLGATLPPRGERKAVASPSGERSAASPKARRSQPSFVALCSAAGSGLGYALWIAVVRPAAADVAPERRLPQFLRESPQPPVAPSVAGTASSPPTPSTLPPELAATLARALHQRLEVQTSEAGAFAGDAGAADAAPALLEDTPGLSPEPVSVEIQRRAEVLRAVLDAQRVEPAAELPASKPRPWMPPAARSTLESSDAGRGPKTAPTAPGEHAEVRALRTRVSPALRPLTTYTYEDRTLFAVATAPLRVTDLTLERGETLVSQPTAGDGARWVISVVQGGDRTHVFVKPLRPGLRTNLTLTTNRRSYFLELSCREDGTYMAGVVWQYPADERARRREALAQAERERQSTTAVSDLQALRFDYGIQVAAGDPDWKPTLVFDDGTKTFIRFPRPVSPDQAPALFLLRSGRAHDATYVNYRIKGDLYVVDRLVEVAELRLGGDADQDVVRITRKH